MFIYSLFFIRIVKMKRIFIYWFVIILLWVSLIFIVSEKSNQLEHVLPNVQQSLTKVSGWLTNSQDNPSNSEETIPPLWDYVCQEGGVQKNTITEPFLQPNCETVPVSGVKGLDSYNVKINSDGFRGREYSVDKPNNTFRVVVLGDSFTFGWGVNLEETYCYLLEQMLNEKYPEKKFEVLNFGVPGMNTASGVRRFKEKALKYNPDVVIIGFTDNDDEKPIIDRLLADYEGEERRVQYEMLRKDKSLKNEDFVKQPLAELEEMARQFNFKILVYSITSEDYQDKYLRKFEKSSRYVYFQEASFSHIDDRKLYLHPLDPHPSAIAHRRYAEEIYNTIDEYDLFQA